MDLETLREARLAWLNRAVVLLEPELGKREILMNFLPRGVRIANLPINVEAEASVLGITVSELECFLQANRYANRPWKILGLVIHEMIHESGISHHGREFQRIADAVGLRGRGAYRGLATWRKHVPSYVLSIVEKLGPFPAVAGEPRPVIVPSRGFSRTKGRIGSTDSACMRA